QRAAAIAQISANTQSANRRAISQAETQNAAIRNNVAAQNAQIQMAEENAAAEDALSYERRQQTAEAKTEEKLQQNMNFNRRLNNSRFNDVRRMNTINQLMENYMIDSQGNIIRRGEGTSDEELKRQFMNYALGLQFPQTTTED